MFIVALVVAVVAAVLAGGVVGGILLVGASAWTVYGGLQTIKRTRRVLAAPVVRADSTATGLVRLRGRVADRSPRIAPFSGKACT